LLEWDMRANKNRLFPFSIRFWFYGVIEKPINHIDYIKTSAYINPGVRVEYHIK